MKVAECIDVYFPTIDGVVITVKNYNDWINKKYGQSTVVTTQVPGSKDDTKDRILRSKSISMSPKKGYRVPVPGLDSKFKKLLKSQQFDLIHAHSPFFIGRYGLKYARKNNIPIIATFHSKFYDDFLQTTKSKFLSKILLKYTMSFYNKVDYVWTVNNSTVATMREYGYKGKVEIMPNGTDLVKPENAEELIQKTREMFSLKETENVFLFVGQHVWQKNLRSTFEATALYKKKYDNFKLIMVGVGDALEELKELARDLDISDHVIFTGRISDREILKGIYLTADIFVFPSIYDNAPLVVREAAICECPPIVVKETGSADRIIDNENGFLCENTPESICDTMIRAVSDKDKLKKIGENAARTIPISWEEAVDKACTRYMEILK